MSAFIKHLAHYIEGLAWEDEFEEYYGLKPDEIIHSRTVGVLASLVCQPYEIEHVFRVARAHDLKEDHRDAYEKGKCFYTPKEREDIDGLTRREGETYADYIERVKHSSRAVRLIKMCDLYANRFVREETCPNSLCKRYDAALNTLRIDPYCASVEGKLRALLWE